MSKHLAAVMTSPSSSHRYQHFTHRRKLPLAVDFAPKIWFILAQTMPTKVETKTNELCEAILEQIKSGGIRQRIDSFLADASARGQYESLMNKGQALQEKQHSGQTLDEAEIKSFEKDRDDLLRNPVASGFLDAQEEMHDLQHSVQKYVAKTIELGRVPSADDLSEGSCGHGCGCHH
jgi:cell fate (sporulation/competence/biofilm development) regulator YlbF (YheA/YmcA/DUF963 family)